MHPLIPSLVSVLFALPEQGLARRVREAVEGASAADIEAALHVLNVHKVLPLLAHQLSVFGLEKSLPEALRVSLFATKQLTGRKNMQLFLCAASILKLAHERREPQLALKGLVFADSYYPDPSTRPMGDIDLVSLRGRHEQLFRIVEDLGFCPSEKHDIQEDGVTYVNKQGLICDAHRTLRMFDPEPWEAIVRETELTKLRGVKVLTLEPNAAVAHLVVHMGGHLPEIGAVLMWLLDLAFVVRRHGPELEPARIRRLCGTDADWALFLRMLGFLESVGERLPPALSASSRFMPALSLGFILRQRRLRPWGLPGALGWLRLLAKGLDLKTYDKKPPIEPDDLWLWPVDEALNALAPRLVRWV